MLTNEQLNCNLIALLIANLVTGVMVIFAVQVLFADQKP
jgi:hypothetical protein